MGILRFSVGASLFLLSLSSFADTGYDLIVRRWTVEGERAQNLYQLISGINGFRKTVDNGADTVYELEEALRCEQGAGELICFTFDNDGDRIPLRRTPDLHAALKAVGVGEVVWGERKTFFEVTSLDCLHRKGVGGPRAQGKFDYSCRLEETLSGR